ncbi:hypothetical protein A33M_0479 [Rhodovulum sp. PH10]|uniref:hypothetical protein n=1 Tax=Rhodovulum sp. PH10 TaxID=1187851 RepID=UPI00027C298B|nr:hypothetical protein [Rhodovulum sp. PH10]EJW10130.1 hypothetical protein A33M_0479 [Rhodovulum sp. PH10]
MATPKNPPLQRSGLSVLALFSASIVTAAVMTVLRLPTVGLPAVFVAFLALALVGFRNVRIATDPAPLRFWEKAVITIAVVLQIVRLVPYALQYLDGTLVAAVNFDDNWHFQEVASLVTSKTFPPMLNFRPDTALHFYYVAWMPAAAFADLFALFGAPLVKLSYALGTLLLGGAAAVVLLLFLRHTLAPHRRGVAFVALFLVGAVPDGAVVIARLLSGTLASAARDPEWWQLGFGVPNQISALSTLVVWVPHHLTSAIALLLAVVITTEPRTLKPRPSFVAFAAAGLLVGVSVYSSAFAVIGGVVALSPLLFRLVASRATVLPATLAAATALLVGLPLAYLYLGSEAAGGFRLFEVFQRWHETFGSVPLALVGHVFAFVFLMAEVGWLAAWALFARDAPRRSVLGQCAVAASLYLLATVVVTFSGANNVSMRGAIVPTIVIAAFWARAVVPDEAGETPWRLPRKALAVLVPAAVLAVVAHVYEIGRHLHESATAIAYSGETDACKDWVMRVNAGLASPTDEARKTCVDDKTVYGIERPFFKDTLARPDRELMGHGP